MKLDAMRRRLAVMERLAGSGVLVVEADAPDLEEQRALAQELGQVLILIDRDDEAIPAGE